MVRPKLISQTQIQNLRSGHAKRLVMASCLAVWRQLVCCCTSNELFIATLQNRHHGVKGSPRVLYQLPCVHRLSHIVHAVHAAGLSTVSFAPQSQKKILELPNESFAGTSGTAWLASYSRQLTVTGPTRQSNTGCCLLQLCATSFFATSSAETPLSNEEGYLQLLCHCLELRPLMS